MADSEFTITCLSYTYSARNELMAVTFALTEALTQADWLVTERVPVPQCRYLPGEIIDQARAQLLEHLRGFAAEVQRFISRLDQVNHRPPAEAPARRCQGCSFFSAWSLGSARQVRHEEPPCGERIGLPARASRPSEIPTRGNVGPIPVHLFRHFKDCSGSAI